MPPLPRLALALLLLLPAACAPGGAREDDPRNSRAGAATGVTIGGSAGAFFGGNASGR